MPYGIIKFGQHWSRLWLDAYSSPSHYLNQCWLITGEVVWYSPEALWLEMLQISIIRICCKITHMKLLPYLPGASQWIDVASRLYTESSGRDILYHLLMFLQQRLLNYCLTHWGRDKMVAIFQTTFSNAFSWMKMFKFRLRFHWSLFPRVQLTIFQHCFR